MDILIIGENIEVYDLIKELELLNCKVVHIKNLAELISLYEKELFDLIILDEHLCDQLTRDELEKIRYLRGKEYGIPIVVFGVSEDEENKYKKNGYSKTISKHHTTEELENFLISVSKKEF